jgi:Beta-lactamase
MFNPALAVFTVPLSYTLAMLDRRSPLHRSWSGLRPSIYLDNDRIYARNFEVPSGGGVGTASAIALAYSVIATGGHELGVREETLQQLMAPAVPPLHGFYDEVMKVEVPFSLGFLKPSPKYPFGHPSAFGAPGTGGSAGFADSQARVGYAYILNRLGTYLEDPRERALRSAMYQSIGITPSFHA